MSARKAGRIRVVAVLGSTAALGFGGSAFVPPAQARPDGLGGPAHPARVQRARSEDPESGSELSTRESAAGDDGDAA
jgi:hypothetical protein